MTVEKLLNFLNNVDLQTLNKSLEQLDQKVQEIFSRTKSDLDSTIVDEIEDRDEEFFIWFCFLRANFLRRKDTISNKAFKQFVDFCKTQKNNYYFNKFPAIDPLLPPFYKPKFQMAGHIEEVLQQLRNKYNSGYEFVKEVEKLADSFETKETHKLYLELIAKFMSFKQIRSKIANAILNEVTWELTLLRKSNKDKSFQRLLRNEWMKKLALASCLNVMIDTHVKKFFEEKLNIKDVEHSLLIFIGKSIKSEVIRFLFERYFEWVKKEDFLTDYHEYIAANMIEKVIWAAYFVKANSLKNENINDLEFFKLSGDLFL